MKACWDSSRFLLVVVPVMLCLPRSRSVWVGTSSCHHSVHVAVPPVAGRRLHLCCPSRARGEPGSPDDGPGFARSQSRSGGSLQRSWSCCCTARTTCRKSSAPPSPRTACCWTSVSCRLWGGPQALDLMPPGVLWHRWANGVMPMGEASGGRMRPPGAGLGATEAKRQHIPEREARCSAPRQGPPPACSGWGSAQT